MASCVVFSNTEPRSKVVIELPDPEHAEYRDFSLFLERVSAQMGFSVEKLLLSSNDEIQSVADIVDSDVLFASQGEDYREIQEPQTQNPVSPEDVYKIAIMGPGTVGKSALALRYVQKIFFQDYDPTIEDAYRTNVVVDGETVLLDILDTAGQEDYVSLRSTWMRQRDGFIMVYSSADETTVEGVKMFFDQLCEMHEKQVPPVILVSNKVDLIKNRTHSMRQLEALAKQFDHCSYMATSAKTGENVDEVFAQLVREMKRSRTTNAASAASVKCGPCCTLM